MARYPILIATADTHFSEKAPIFRSNEPDWFEAMSRQLIWLSRKQREFQCPVIIAGDLFDRPIVTTRLINFINDYLPESYTIAGNHDLLYHNIDNLDKSGYGCLIRTGRIHHIENDTPAIINIGDISIALHGFNFNPNGLPHCPCQKRADFDIAIVHNFLWTGTDKRLERERPNDHVGRVRDFLPGYDFYLFGDNHTPFTDGTIINCGAFYRRTKGNETYYPHITVIYNTGEVGSFDIPTENDIFTVSERSGRVIKNEYNFSTIFDLLREGERLACDVDIILDEYLKTNTLDTDVRQAILTIRDTKET